MSLETRNPATGDTIKMYETLTQNKLNEILEAVSQRFTDWKKKSYQDRSRYMHKASEILTDNIDEYSSIITTEMGKPINQARAEVEKCSWVCEFYAEKAQKFLKDDSRESDASSSYVSYQPLGPVLAVMPWNYPFWQVFRFAAPALMAGNTALLKHAPNVTGCAFKIEKIFEEAGFPSDTFRTLPISVEQTQNVIEDSRVKAATLTGSTRAGRSVASQAGSQIKKTVLELGGTDPYLILEDADLNRAANQCVSSRMLNSGQSCIAAKRYIVDDSVYEPFLEKIQSLLENQSMGNPEESKNDIGPMARFDLRDELHNQVQRSIEAGATCKMGGEIPNRKGAYYPPTLLTEPGPENPARKEELFGPVAVTIRVDDADEAIEVANENSFGLGAAVFTQDKDLGERIARNKLNAGCCFVNQYVKSDPRLPFGGIKQSGYGRELSKEGIREFVNTKTVYVN